MAKKARKFFEVFRDPKTYYNFFYLLLLFPLGIFSFVIVTALITLSLALISAPLLAPFIGFELGFGGVIGKFLVSIVLMCLGVLLLAASFHLLSSLADIFRKILKIFS